jgi:hypothetical protein
MTREITSTIVSALLLSVACCEANALTPPLHFKDDTAGFANMTVFEYENGIAHVRRGESAKQKQLYAAMLRSLPHHHAIQKSLPVLIHMRRR